MTHASSNFDENSESSSVADDQLRYLCIRMVGTLHQVRRKHFNLSIILFLEAFKFQKHFLFPLKIYYSAILCVMFDPYLPLIHN